MHMEEIEDIPNAYESEKWFLGWVSVQVKDKGVTGPSSNWMRRFRMLFNFLNLDF